MTATATPAGRPTPRGAAPGRTPAGQAPAGQTPSGQGPAFVEQTRRFLRELFAGTPGRMRLFAGACAVACVLFGIGSGLSAWSSASAVQRAQANTEQVVRADTLAANLLLADATATNSYLRGGSQNAQDRQTYDDALAEATRLVAQAAAAQPQDAAALAALNSTIEDYSELAEHARAANRQGLVVGQRYQQEASSGLRSQSMPLITAVRDANTSRLVVGDGIGETNWPVLQLVAQLLLGLLIVAALLLLWRWLARRTRRKVNVGVASAGALILVGLLLALVAQGATVGRMSSFREGALRDATGLSQARTAIYDARANESLTLIARGSGQDSERSWTAATSGARELLAEHDPESTSLLDDYVTQHRQMRALDDEQGNWAGAVELSVDPQRSGFAPLDEAVTASAERAAADANEALRSRILLVLTTWLLPLLGLAAAVLVVRGVAPRIEEYR